MVATRRDGMPRRDRFITVDGFELHYSEWGEQTAPPVLCVHGLARVGRDFDPLARALQDRFRVLCPDVLGRGLSEWAADPTAYAHEAIASRLGTLCDRLDLGQVRFVGTSMGARVGLALAGGQFASRLSHLVVNDMPPDPGTDANPTGLERIMDNLPAPPTVARVTELEAYYRDLYGGRYGEMSDEEWRRFTVTSARRTDDGGITPAYDPRLVAAVGGPDETPGETRDPWTVWRTAETDLQIIRGASSETLPGPAFERMTDARPDARTLTVDCGHTPMLNSDREIATILSFLAN
ncbi:MAG: pimeloyl-ACP methyl ester carboxylesterase [Haloarculaceae archaeon]|jgi:pimeloyl-ACP methyl ester carboxylesterase